MRGRPAGIFPAGVEAEFAVRQRRQIAIERVVSTSRSKKMTRWPRRASALHRPRHSVAWPFPHDELTVRPKMTNFIQPCPKHPPPPENGSLHSFQPPWWSGIVPGFSTPPLMLLILPMTNNRAIMAERVNSQLANVFG